MCHKTSGSQTSIQSWEHYHLESILGVSYLQTWRELGDVTLQENWRKRKWGQKDMGSVQQLSSAFFYFASQKISGAILKKSFIIVIHDSLWSALKSDTQGNPPSPPSLEKASKTPSLYPSCILLWPECNWDTDLVLQGQFLSSVIKLNFRGQAVSYSWYILRLMLRIYPSPARCSMSSL